MSEENITILRKVALEILNQARHLFEDGSGIPIYPIDDEEETLGLIDDVDASSDLYLWMNAVLGFIRLVYGVTNHAIEGEPDIFANDENT